MDGISTTISPVMEADFIRRAPSIDAVLRWRAEHQPARIAFTWLRDGTEPDAPVTYHELDRQARAIAATLEARLRHGDRVLLCFPEGIEFIAAFFGCLYAGMIAVPTPFPDTMRSRRSLARLNTIAVDAMASLALLAEPVDAVETAFPDWQYVYTRSIPRHLANTWQPRDVATDLAYLQYTSGSTSVPKGVMVRHRNVMHNLLEMMDTGDCPPDSVLANWMPNFHDYGLIEGIIRPIYNGAPSYLFSPRAFLRRPVCWLEAITCYGVTQSGAAAFAFDYCVQRIDDGAMTGLDLSHWKHALIGAEPVRPRTLRAFSEKFAAVGFQPQAFAPAYGLAEATLMVTIRNLRVLPDDVPATPAASNGAGLVPCGRPYGECRVVIVDPTSRTRQEGDTPGEIWVAGPSVTAGYWNRPEETRATFGAYLADSGEGPFLRTGDIGFVRDEDLFITGRIKNVIISHGTNYHAEDIEWAILKGNPLLQDGTPAVFSVPGDTTERVVVVFEVARTAMRDFQAEPICEAIRQVVAAEFGISVHAIALVRRGAIPRTSSGKLQRHLCRSAYLEGMLEPLASWRLDAETGRGDVPQSGLEAELARLWQELLGVPSVRVDSDFFTLGGDSLLALQLAVRVEERWDRPLPPEFFQRPTVEHLATLLRPTAGYGVDVEPPPALVRIGTKQPRRRRRLRRIRRAARLPLRLVRDPRQARRVAERTAFRLPYRLGHRWLTWWFGRRMVQAILYPREVALAQTYLGCLGVASARRADALRGLLHGRALGSGSSRVTAGATSVREFDHAFGSTSESFWRPFSGTGGKGAPDQSVVFSGEEHVEHARGRCGVLLVTYHSPYVYLGVPALATLAFEAVFFVQRQALQKALRDLVPGSDSLDGARELPAVLAAHANAARACLLRGGLVVIIADGQIGRGATIHLPIATRLFPFRTGFAELALNTGAAVVPTTFTMQPDGRLHIALHPALDPGAESCPHDQRVHYLVRQFAAFFETGLSRDPASLHWRKVGEFVRLPLAPEEPSHA